jgi:hypothetical protein
MAFSPWEGLRRGSQLKVENFSLRGTRSALTGYAIIFVAVSIAVLAILDPYLTRLFAYVKH